MSTAVIYVRFSCSKQREASIDDQLRVCREWCAREGYAIVAEYSDYAISGRTDERPEFQRMIERAGESEPEIIDKETWTMAQNVKSTKQRKREEWSDFILSGRAICGHCGRNLVGVSGRNSRNVKYNYYRCSKRCGDVSPVAKDWLEDKVAESLREFVSNRDRAVEIARVVAEHAKSDKITQDIERAQETVRKASSALENIQRAIEQGVFTESITARIEELTAQRDRALAFIESAKQFDFSVDELADFLQYGSTLSDRQMIDALVWQVSLTDDEIIVTLNYDVAPDVAQKITLDGFAQELEWHKKARTPQVSDVRTEFEWLPTDERIRTTKPKKQTSEPAGHELVRMNRLWLPG